MTACSDIRIPEYWPERVKEALLHVASMVHWTLIQTRSWAADSPLARVRALRQADELEQEVALVNEQMRIVASRWDRIPPKKRPHYHPSERLAILELKATRGWNAAQTARAFGLDPETVRSWVRRTNNAGDDLLRTSTPVNRFPEFVRYVVQRLKALCPTMGKRRIAETLARAGLSLSATTVSRMLSASGLPEGPTSSRTNGLSVSPPTENSRVTAKHVNHIWHVDLTVVPTSGGLWTSWFPWSSPTVWPFCWHVAVLIDHCSRKVMGFALFKRQPTSVAVRQFLGMAIRRHHAQPRHIISDRGKQFDCDGYRRWCRRRGIKYRYGAIGRYGSIAVIERLMRTMKDECTRVVLIPLRLKDMRTELSVYVTWYNQFRPHQALDGKTPCDVYDDIGPPDPLYSPNTMLPKLALHVSHYEGRRHLPVVELRRAA